MGRIAEMLVNLGRVSVRMGEMLLADIRPETFARKPRLGDTVIETNHPAFVYGHLSLYPAQWAAAAGVAAPDAVAPASYADLFSAGCPCRDDPDGRLYPPMDQLVAVFRRTHESALAALPRADDARLLGPNPRGGRSAERFPTLGALLAFYMTSHMMMHLGQVSAWRRCMGLGPVM